MLLKLIVTLVMAFVVVWLVIDIFDKRKKIKHLDKIIKVKEEAYELLTKGNDEKKPVVIKKTYQDRKQYGDSEEKKVSKWLYELMNEYIEKDLISEFYILNDLDFKTRIDQVYLQIDHVVVCDKGIFIVETKGWSGDIYYYGNPDNFYESNETIFTNDEIKAILQDRERLILSVWNTTRTDLSAVKEVNKLFTARVYPDFKRQVRKQGSYLYDLLKENEDIQPKWINSLVVFSKPEVHYHDKHRQWNFTLEEAIGTRFTLDVVISKFGMDKYFLNQFERINIRVPTKELNEIYKELKKYERKEELK